MAKSVLEGIESCLKTTPLPREDVVRSLLQAASDQIKELQDAQPHSGGEEKSEKVEPQKEEKTPTEKDKV